MVAKPVVLRTFRWDTITKAKEAFKAILHGYGLNEQITDATHVAMLHELLERHPRVAEKTGAGVDYFYVGRTQQEDGSVKYWNGRGIWIRRVDGSSTDFGYNAAITWPSQKADVKDAFRHAVSPQRDAYREARFLSGDAVACCISGEPIGEADAQVIYVDPTWEQLTFRFAESEGGWDRIAVSAGEGAALIGGRLADPDVLGRWLEFFGCHANMQLASRSAASRRPWSDEKEWSPSA
ncbi:hypothetical protein Ddc_22950 [Ditylenchus destructor]|nr:hypothetical protein Ddc_22950 [Ditylenchus destructor]